MGKYLLSQLKQVDVHIHLGSVPASVEMEESGFDLIIGAFAIVGPVDLDHDQATGGAGNYCR